MSDLEVDLQRNAQATRRLAALVERLDRPDLERSLGGGWTVAFALVHLAFWDARQDVALRVFADGGAFPSEDVMTNATLAALASAFDADVAGATAVAAAERLDATIAGLSAGQPAELEAAGQWYAIQRWPHREEHMGQIEAVVG